MILSSSSSVSFACRCRPSTCIPLTGVAWDHPMTLHSSSYTILFGLGEDFTLPASTWMKSLSPLPIQLWWVTYKFMYITNSPIYAFAFLSFYSYYKLFSDLAYYSYSNILFSASGFLTFSFHHSLFLPTFLLSDTSLAHLVTFFFFFGHSPLAAVGPPPRIPHPAGLAEVPRHVPHGQLPPAILTPNPPGPHPLRRPPSPDQPRSHPAPSQPHPTPPRPLPPPTTTTPPPVAHRRSSPPPSPASISENLRSKFA